MGNAEQSVRQDVLVARMDRQVRKRQSKETMVTVPRLRKTPSEMTITEMYWYALFLETKGNVRDLNKALRRYERALHTANRRIAELSTPASHAINSNGHVPSPDIEAELSFVGAI